MIVIRPSSLYKFYTAPSEWFRETYLGEKTFLGNKSTELGTLCHKVYENYYEGMSPEDNRAVIENLIADLPLKEHLNEDDIKYIVDNYKNTANTVIADYICKRPPPIASEQKLEYALYDDLVLKGTVDLLQEDGVADFKHISKKPSSDGINSAHKLQLGAYAFLAEKKLKHHSRYLTIVYGIHALKTVPARCMVAIEENNEANQKYFNDTLELIVEKHKRIKADPTLVTTMFNDLSLKGEWNG